jgi:exportin-5
VAFSTTALDKKVTFMLKVLEHILMSKPVEQPEFGSYNDAVKELQVDGMYELQRLASKMPDQLLVSRTLHEKLVDANQNIGCV